jgi:GT2 family glycosyltransferase
VAPLVSILIPAYKAERFLADTIRSALGQTWPNKEIIVVDDGSPDRTFEIASAFQDRRMKVLRQENAGAARARNVAYSHAQGAYIQWLDADDLLAPEKIELQIQSVEQEASNKILLASAFGEFFVCPERARFVPTSLWRDASPVDHLICKFSDNAWLNPATWLVSRELADDAGPWDERLTLDDDGEYFTRVVARSAYVCFVPLARTYYRRGNVSSLSRRSSEAACESLLLSLRLCIQQLIALEDSPRTRAAAIKLLRNFVRYTDFFWPDRNDRIQQIGDIARSVGGTIAGADVDWKYRRIAGIFGWSAARWTRSTWSNIKCSARAQLDRGLVVTRARRPLRDAR